MKKLFALLSALVLSLAIIGLAAPQAQAAEGKWTVDPTLAKDEIPMYEMGSIYTTFPNFYDNAAEPDALWGGTARMYPWNETRLRVAQYDDNGATGKYYAIYFSGLTQPTDSAGNPANAAGYNINGYNFQRNADGTYNKELITTVRVNNPKKADTLENITVNSTTGKVKDGNFDYGATPADPSLSHMRINFAGEDIHFDGIELANRIGDGNNAMNFYNRMFVYDGQGRIIRGVGTDAFYNKPVEGSTAEVWAPMFAKVDGKYVKYEEGMTVDKVKVQAKDDQGNPLFEDEAQTKPVMVDGEEDDLLYKRFVWEWFEQEPTNVNKVSYLSEGWDCDLWDYVMPMDGGYMAIAFVRAEGSNHKIDDVDREVTNATRAAKGEAALPEGDHYRECLREIRVPKDGGTFDFGYLDKMVATEAAKFNDIIKGAFYFGRTVDSCKVKTYNFSTTGLRTIDKVSNNYSYQLMDGKNYIEVMQGQSFKPAANIIYEGLASGYQKEDDVLSYEKDLDGLSYTLYVDGEMVVYKYPYANKAEMVADFENDVKKWFAPGTAAGGEEGKFQNFTVADTEAVGWDFISTAANAKCFWGSAANREKWVWMINYVASVRKANGLATAAWETINDGYTSSPGTFNAEVSAFLNDTQKNPGAWNRTSDYSIPENANGFLPKESNQTSFNNYTIDTTEAHVDQIYTVKYIVKNKSGIEDTMTIKYVVVDGYTPIIKVNKNALLINPDVVDGKKVINAIDPMTLVEAYNGQYNGKNILGDVITQNVHFTSETLDFNNPTEGTHKVTATVYNSAKRYASVTFTVSIADVTAPYAEFYSSLVLPYGTTWDPKLTVQAATDNVNGNLFNATFTWCVDESSKAVNTTKPGTYKVMVSVYDAAGNSVSMPKAINVVVLPQGATEEAVSAQATTLAAIQASLETLGLDVTDILEKMPASTTEELAAIKAAVESLPQGATEAQVKAAINEAVAGVKTDVKGVSDQVTGLANAKGCSKNSVMFFEFLSAGCLLVFLLRKKH